MRIIILRCTTIANFLEVKKLLLYLHRMCTRKIVWL